MRIGDLELNNWKEKYRALGQQASSHDFANYTKSILQYDLEELEDRFLCKAIEELKQLTFIDSEEYLFQAQKKQ